MMQKVLSIIAIGILFCNKVIAQQTKGENHDVNLEAYVDSVHQFNHDFSLVSFKLISSSEHTSKIKVSIENTQPSETLMLFHSDKTDKQLKKETPKLVFDKTFGGDKGKRCVSGCSELIKYNVQIKPSETQEFEITVDNKELKELTIPFYFVTTKRTGLFGRRRTKIFREDVKKYNISVTVWNENDQQFVDVKKLVDTLISNLENTKFCTHKQHAEPIEQQQDVYKQRINQLINQIDRIRRDWVSGQSPHRLYTDLIEKLTNINLDDYNIDNCGQHGTPNSIHKCAYCYLSEIEILHQIGDLYEALYINKITKEEASRKASSLYQCYEKKKRNKTASNKSKIVKIYNRIVGK